MHSHVVIGYSWFGRKYYYLRHINLKSTGSKLRQPMYVWYVSMKMLSQMLADGILFQAAM